jgi:hypothetical protein
MRRLPSHAQETATKNRGSTPRSARLSPCKIRDPPRIHLRELSIQNPCTPPTNIREPHHILIVCIVRQSNGHLASSGVANVFFADRFAQYGKGRDEIFIVGAKLL